MRKFRFLCLFCLISALSVSAASQKQIPYKNIKENAKVVYSETSDVWRFRTDKKNEKYWIKRISEESGNYSEYCDNSGEFDFSTGTQYEFIHNGNLIGYSNQDLKFYDFVLINGELHKIPLDIEEVQKLFPDYKIVKLSEFSKNTSSLKIKKTAKNMKIILFNDIDKDFYNYSFSSNNAEYSTFELSGFIEISKKGMIQFSHFGGNTENNPWYILLVR